MQAPGVATVLITLLASTCIGARAQAVGHLDYDDEVIFRCAQKCMDYAADERPSMGHLLG